MVVPIRLETMTRWSGVFSPSNCASDAMALPISSRALPDAAQFLLHVVATVGDCDPRRPAGLRAGDRGRFVGASDADAQMPVFEEAAGRPDGGGMDQMTELTADPYDGVATDRGKQHPALTAELAGRAGHALR